MQWGTPNTPRSLRLMLLGSGELGREVAVAAQRLGIEVIAVDRYAHAPAMALAHRAHVIDMLNGAALRELVLQEKPTFIVPEIEAIDTHALVDLEAEGWRVVPTARATRLTMDREGIRRLAAETLGLPVSRYCFVQDREAYLRAVAQLGLPCVIKPLMSSSGKGQSIVRTAGEVETAWRRAQECGRSGGGAVIVEAFVAFDCELTLLTVRHSQGTSICAPIGHLQVDGDYRESWQPHALTPAVAARCEEIACDITAALGGHGLFGVELFVAGDEVLFSEVSPRPHDTGMVTMISQEPDQFELHVRAILGLPIPAIRQRGASASCAILGCGDGVPNYSGCEDALMLPDTELRLFGKPFVNGQRRLGVALARASDIDTARARAREAAAAIRIGFDADVSARVRSTSSAMTGTDA